MAIKYKRKHGRSVNTNSKKENKTIRKDKNKEQSKVFVQENYFLWVEDTNKYKSCVFKLSNLFYKKKKLLKK